MITVKDFAEKIINGPGGLNSFEQHELVVFHASDRIVACEWTLRCLANPDCEGSEEAIQAILAKRNERRGERCTCHSGSVCTAACDEGKHHGGCVG